MLKDFKEFAMKGNVVDMAVGVVIGVSFGKIVTSLVNDIIMPPIGVLTGGMDFSNLVITLKEAAEGTVAVTINYGIFLNAVFDFLIVAFAIFVTIKQIKKLKKKEEKKPKEKKPTQEELLSEIRDLLKKK